MWEYIIFFFSGLLKTEGDRIEKDEETIMGDWWQIAGAASQMSQIR